MTISIMETLLPSEIARLVFGKGNMTCTYLTRPTMITYYLAGI